MNALKNIIKTYFTAWGFISLPFLILIVASFWFTINPEVIVYGLTFSFLSSFVIAYNFRQYEETVPCPNDKLFYDLMNSLSKLGYLIKDRNAQLVVFEPSVHTHLFAGKIAIHLAENSATIVGSRLPVRKSLAMTLKKDKRALFQHSDLKEDCVNVWAEKKIIADFIPSSEDCLVNSTEFEHTEEIRPEIIIEMPEEN